jgi:MoaA/NifB/PqqE/SkfB family radical SAM enzyme
MPDLPVYNHLQVEVTSRCNLRCRTCLYGHYPERWVEADLSRENLDRLLEAAPRCRSVHLQGWGESLLRSDCAGLVGRMKKAGLMVSLSSNGSCMSSELARELMEAGLDSMAFSFAGTSAAEQDPLRGAGTFARAAASAALFSRCRPGPHPPVLMNFMLLKSNRHSLPRVLCRAGRLGMDRVDVGHFIQCVSPAQADWAVYPEQVVGRQRLFWLRLSVLWRRATLGLPSMKGQPTAVCPKNPLENLFIGADGTVSPCVYLNPPLKSTIPRFAAGRLLETPRLIMGRLSEQSLDEIWNRPAYRAFRDIFQHRVEAYHHYLADIKPDSDGLAKLERAVVRLASLFKRRLAPPAPCCGCPHLEGF